VTKGGDVAVLATPVSEVTYAECRDLLFLEAEYLDDNRLREWLDLYDRDAVYQVPIRITRERAAGAGFSTDSFHMDDDWHSLETRVARLETEYAWAEDPASRLRHLVGNVRVTASGSPDEVGVKSNVLIFRGRSDSPDFHLLSAERRDLLRRHPDGWRIARRLVLLDHTSLGTHNLSILL